MNPPHTYQNKFGIFYFRRVLPKGNKLNRTEIRVSLHTRVASRARISAYRAWLVADSMIAIGHVDAFTIRTAIQSALRLTGTQKLSDSSLIKFGPELIRLTDVINSWDTAHLQAVIRRISDDRGEIFAPFEGDECTFFPIREHGRPNSEEYENYLTTPLHIGDLISPDIVLTTKGVESACFSVNGNFEIDEFYSYHPGSKNSDNEFTKLITPSQPLRLMVIDLKVSEEVASNLQVANLVPTNEATTQAPPVSNLISEELRDYCDEFHTTTGIWSDRTRVDNETVFDTFVEIIGDKPVSEITDADVKKYIQKLTHLPAHRKKVAKFSGLDALGAIELNAKDKGATISNKTKQKYKQRLTVPFDRFVIKGYIPYNFIKEAKGHKISKADKRNTRKPFTLEDFKIMFEGAESIAQLNTKREMPSRPWGLLIALFTGARSEEIFSLTTDDIKEDNGILYFDIWEREGHNTLKNEAAVRGVPIHPKLIELGFLDYLDKAKKVQSDRPIPMLFPDITKSPEQGWSRNTGRWINEQYLPKIGIKTDKLKVLHSFRHSLSDLFRRSDNVNQLKVSAYIGHEDDYGKLPTWQTGYGSPFRPSELVDIAKAIKYDLDFDKLKTECLDKIRPRRIKTQLDKN